MHILQAVQKSLAAYPHLEAHSNRTAMLVSEAGKLLRLTEPTLTLLATAAYTHDLGKTMWPDELFAKFPLTPMDWGLIKAHPVLSENLAVEMWREIPGDMWLLIRGHHERPGGKGYPDELNEPGIELLLLAACDSFDAMTHDREYRPNGALPVETALLEIAEFAPAQIVAALAGVVLKRDGNGNWK